MLLVLVALGVLLGAGCGPDTGDRAAGDRAGAGPAGDGGVTVLDPWGRPTPPGARTSAFYLLVENRGPADDRLLAASSDRCRSIELHDSRMIDGVLAMRPATHDALRVPAGELLELEPAGLHAMCIAPSPPLVEGERIRLVLDLDDAGPITTDLVVEQR